MSYARDERDALCDLLERLGPDQPTLCAGWRTVDLAAHLVLRERRPDAGIGILGGALSGYTRRVQRRLAGHTPFPRLVELIRTGPPRLSPLRLPGADASVNTLEFFVHHEDIRRGQPGWTSRDLPSGMSELLWRRLRRSRLVLRHAPVGVELVRTDNSSADVRFTAKARTPVVTVSGAPAELTMWVTGRTGAADVNLDGRPDDIAALRSATWRI